MNSQDGNIAYEKFMINSNNENLELHLMPPAPKYVQPKQRKMWKLANLLKATWSKDSGKIAKIHFVFHVMLGNLCQETAQVFQQAVVSIRQLFQEFFQVIVLLSITSSIWKKEGGEKSTSEKGVTTNLSMQINFIL